MPEIPQDFLNLLPHTGLNWDGPPYVLWIFDPMTGTAKVEDNQGKHEAERITPHDLGQTVPHPERVQGYAYKIKDGWRITDLEHKPVVDPYIIDKILKALR